MPSLLKFRYAKSLLRCVYTFLLALVLLFGPQGAAVVIGQTEFDDFESNVRPLLVKYCIQCHGPEKQESDLRLDGPAYWEKGGISGSALIPGKPSESLIIRAVGKEDPDLAMPPGDTALDQNEIEILKEWIRQGAKAPRITSHTEDQRLDIDEAPEFWSFMPVKSVTPPTSETIDAWSWTPIDNFVFARLQEHGLKPVGEASRRTLIRRATYDLTGLPPTPHEIHSYLNDNSSNAFAIVVERLLASDAYGERWGRHWLDVARYADTAGDGADYPVREAYKYRDWVINAINSDKPYDQFLREQLAGDILAKGSEGNEYRDLVTATGFLAIGKRYGYKPSPDYQHLDFADAIDSVGRSLMGLSLGCARCHDHKYDPVSAEDYYALYGIFQSTNWAFPGGEEQKRPSQFPATIPIVEVERLQQLREQELERHDNKVAELVNERRTLDVQWRAGGPDLGLEKQTLGMPLQAPWVSSGPVKVHEDAQSPFINVHAKGTRGVRISGGLKTDGIRYVFEPGLRVDSNPKMYFNLDFRIAADSKEGVSRFYLGQGVVQSLAVEFSVSSSRLFLRNGSEWEGVASITPGKWYSLQIEIDSTDKIYRGTVNATDSSVAFAGKKTAPGWNGIADCFICDGFGHEEGPVLIRDIDNVALIDVELLPVGKKVAVAEISDADAVRVAQIDKQLSELEETRARLTAKPIYPVAYGVSEGSKVNAYVQLRGEPENVGVEVPRRFLEVLGGEMVPENSEGSGRLELANWIASARNPLTARVFVNRVWQWHFGRGLVNTPSDFGYRGEKPSHPALLDWLTAEFVRSGWSLKQLNRSIMLSHVYQLSSEEDLAAKEVDPENVMHWRFTRRPLDAESMRDSMLALSGNLKRTVPGPHPFPDVDSWGFTIHHPFHAVYESNHRSVYLMQQRNRRHPYLELFDSADPNVSIGKRQQTVTPTQALYLMNSEFVHAQAQGLATRILEKYESDEERVKYAFELVHGLNATDVDMQFANVFLESYRTELIKQDAVEIEQSVWEAFSRVMLTSNNFLFVD